MKQSEKQWLDRVASLGCYLCRHLGYGPTPAQIHHVREGVGMSQRASNWTVIPLCEKHHANSSPDGIHGGRRAWKLAQVDEIDGLADTIERLMS